MYGNWLRSIRKYRKDIFKKQFHLKLERELSVNKYGTGGFVKKTHF